MPQTAVLAVLLAPAAFLVVAVLARSQPGLRPARVLRAISIASTLGVVVAGGAGLAVLRGGVLESPTLGIAGLGLSIRLDALSTIMLAMIALLAVAIVRYSGTYLDGDARHGVFLGRLAQTIAAVELLVLSGNLGLLVLAWIATSLSLHRLLLFYPQRWQAVLAARKKFLAARLGDVLLIAAAALLYHRFGTGSLEGIFVGMREAGASGWQLDEVGLAAAALAVAAALKSAQFPTHGWLVEVMETPTPVSALLHAGILNAGPFLVTRFAFVVEGANVATVMLLAVGGFTALFASVVLLTQPSIKVALGYSSVAHMGFMLLVCGLGIYPAAMLHLVAHSFYKAHAFLASGSVIDEARAARVALPRRSGSPVRVALSVLTAIVLYVASGLLLAPAQLRDPLLLALGAMLVLGLAQIIAPALDSRGPLLGAARAAGLALGVAAAFFLLEAGAYALLSEVLPAAAGRSVAHLVLIGLILAVFATVVLLQILHPVLPPSARRTALAIHLRNGLYANALLDRAVGGLREPALLVGRR
ncbi:MAG: proton-conducting transporter membrane subunit [Nitriliruptoraceae bacterium]